MLLIRHESYIKKYLIMDDGVLYSITQENLAEIIKEEKYRIIRHIMNPCNAYSMPIKVQLQVTTACNLRCVTCAVNQSQVIKDSARMSFENWKSLIESLVDHGVLNVEWSGGEPMLANGLFPLMKCAHDLGLQQNMLTNGMFFNNKNVDFLKKFCYRIQVSLDATDILYEKIVGVRGSWNKFKNSLYIATENTLPIVAATVLQRDNVAVFCKIVDFCGKNKIKNLRISLQVPIGNSVSVKWKDYLSVIDSFRKNYEGLKKIANDKGVVLNCFLEKETCLDETVDDVSRIVSPGGYSFLYINSKGEIYPFPFLTSPELLLGSYFRDDIHSIWLNSPILRMLRNCTYRNTGCGNCRQECSFAERSLVYAFSGKIDGVALPHVECDYRKEVMLSCQK